MKKQITFLNKNSELLISTLDEFCNPIISTLGPGGRTVIIADNDGGLPHVTKDGVTVSESIHFPDDRKQAIASLIKEAARKTASAVGDGTTTSIVLTKAMILNALDNLKLISNVKEFYDGFDLAFEHVTDYLTESSIHISKDPSLIESVVQISTNGDSKICKTIMSAIDVAGEDGIINVEVHEEGSTIVDLKSGSSLDSNTHIPTGVRWETNSPLELILVSGPIREIYEIKPIILALSKSKHSAIIIAKEFSESVINTINVNNYRRSINVALVESEGFTKQAKMDILEDISTIFDVKIYSTDGMTGLSLSDYTPQVSYNLSKAIVTATETILIRTFPELPDTVLQRYEELKSKYNSAKSSIESSSISTGALQHLQRRMSKYNSVATIKVGAATKAEALEIKDRIDDALCSVSSALRGGVLPGGGSSLLKAYTIFSAPETLSNDAKVGYNTFINSCAAPFRMICKNSGIELTEKFKDNELYDFREFKIVTDAIESGIIDPALVTITALANSSSVAKTILKSNSIITRWQEPEDE